MSAVNQIAYLNCELKARDLESRMLVAAYLLKAGWAVIVGQFWGIMANAPTSPKGCYLFTTANRFQADAMEMCRRHGHIVVAQDEEALPFAGDGLLDNIDAAAMRHADAFLAQSDEHAAVVKQKYASAPIKIAGSARVDLMQKANIPPSDEAPYILFNTNFALINSGWGQQAAIDILKQGSPISDEEIRLRLDVERLSQERMLDVIARLSAKNRCVVRPHPAEDPAFWRKIPGCDVVVGSNPLPWIKHARVLVHANSTTGLEAAVLGVPCLNLDPITAWGRRFVMHKINYTVKTAKDAATALAAFFEGKMSLHRPTADTMFPSNAGANIAREITNFVPQPNTEAGANSWTPTTRQDRQRQKFTVSSEELAAAWAHVASIVPVAGVRMRQLDDSVFFLKQGG